MNAIVVVHSKAHEQIIDITEDVAAAAAAEGDGICGLFVQHTLDLAAR